MSDCTRCGEEIDWKPIPKKFRPDGSQLSVPVNLNGEDHICKNRKVPGDKWKPRWNILNKLPVYCNTCRYYYATTKPCTHLISMGFIPHTPEHPTETWSFPPRYHERMLRQQREMKKDIASNRRMTEEFF